MAAPTAFTVSSIEDFGSTEEYARYLAGLIARGFREYNWMLAGNLRSTNIMELTADKIITGTLLAQLVTIQAALNGDATITIDGEGFKAAFDSGTTITIDENGLTINNGTKDTFKADAAGNVTVEGTINASEINGSNINGGNINVDTDVHIGSKLYMNKTSFTSDIIFNDYVRMYGEPAAKVLQIYATNGVLINGQDILSTLSTLQTTVNNIKTKVLELDDRVDELESGA